MALSKIDVSKMITGVTPLANGGTGGTSIPATNLASGVTGTLPVGSGGTGLTAGTTNQFLKFTGTTTVASSTLGDTGKVGQVVSASKQTVASFSSSSTNTFVDLAGLTLDITPSAASSKILILSTACIAESTSATIHVRLLRDSTVINGGDPQSSQLDSMNSVRYQSATPYGQALYDVSQNFLDSPNTTSQITYKLQGTLGASYSGTYYLNRSDSDSDADFGSRTPSNLTAIEILA